MTKQEKIERVLNIVEAQANDEGLWFVATRVTEQYLQQELRRLHAAIEELKGINDHTKAD